MTLGDAKNIIGAILFVVDVYDGPAELSAEMHGLAQEFGQALAGERRKPLELAARLSDEIILGSSSQAVLIKVKAFVERSDVQKFIQSQD